MNHKLIRYTLGWVLGLEGLCMLLPFICSLVYKEQMYTIFGGSMLLCIILGIILIQSRPKNKSMYAKEGYTIVALSWIVMSVFGAIPFVLSGAIPRIDQALFETASGFTTTGASVLSDVEALPKSLLFWRSFTHWIGGMGILVFLVAIIQLSGSTNMHLVKAESTGPKVGKLVPKIRSTAKILYGIYLAMTVTEIILLKLGGLDWFEALTLSFGTAGTGGFGVKNSGCADYTSYQQIVIAVFMMLFGIDFSFYYAILMRKFRQLLHYEEVKTYLGIIIFATVVIALNCLRVFSNTFDSFKNAFFQVSSIITTTGYSTADFDKWPEFSKALLVTLMFVGACAGSTGGGIKVSRIIILLKSVAKEIKIAAHPNRIYKISMNGKLVEHETVRAINVFMCAYVAIYFISLLIISFDNMDFTTNFTAVVATLNNIGPGLAGVGPTKNFSEYSVLSTIILTVNMLIGRLEIFPMIVLMSPHTWKK